MKNEITKAMSTVMPTTASLLLNEDAEAALNLVVPLILRVDSYKAEHWWADNEDVQFSQIYLEARDGDSMFAMAGLRDMMLLLTQRITQNAVNFAERVCESHVFGSRFNRAGWEAIVNDFDGCLPIEVKAVREGTIVDGKTPMLVVRNTAPGFAWLVKYFGDMIMRVWDQCAAATNNVYQKAVILDLADGTVDDDVAPLWVPKALHDFGSRSTGASERSAQNGSSQLLYWTGSDNWESIYRTMRNYNLGMDEIEKVATSVFAIEHNTVLTYGEEREFELFEKLVREILLNGRIGSILIDTFDIDRAIQWFCDNADNIIEWAKQGGGMGRVVLRPDSGCPVETPIMVLKALIERFPVTVNTKGCNVLPWCIGVIQGDGNNKAILQRTARRLTEERIAGNNMVFGEGGELISNFTRDGSGQWAAKVSVNTMSDGSDVSCCKKPKYDSGKKSKEGYFRLTEDQGGIIRLEESDGFDDSGLLETCFRNGKLMMPYSFEETREFADAQLQKFRRTL